MQPDDVRLRDDRRLLGRPWHGYSSSIRDDPQPFGPRLIASFVVAPFADATPAAPVARTSPDGDFSTPSDSKRLVRVFCLVAFGPPTKYGVRPLAVALAAASVASRTNAERVMPTDLAIPSSHAQSFTSPQIDYQQIDPNVLLPVTTSSPK